MRHGWQRTPPEGLGPAGAGESPLEVELGTVLVGARLVAAARVAAMLHMSSILDTTGLPTRAEADLDGDRRA